MSRQWTEEEEKILKSMHEKGCDIKQMEEVIKSRTGNGIRNKLDSLGLGPPIVKPDIDYDLFKKLTGVEEV